jgi:hypothetical protein
LHSVASTFKQRTDAGVNYLHGNYVNDLMVPVNVLTWNKLGIENWNNNATRTREIIDGILDMILVTLQKPLEKNVNVVAIQKNVQFPLLRNKTAMIMNCNGYANAIIPDSNVLKCTMNYTNSGRAISKNYVNAK